MKWMPQRNPTYQMDSEISFPLAVVTGVKSGECELCLKKQKNITKPRPVLNTVFFFFLSKHTFWTSSYFNRHAGFYEMKASNKSDLMLHLNVVPFRLSFCVSLFTNKGGTRNCLSPFVIQMGWLFVCLFGLVFVFVFVFEANKIHGVNCWVICFQESIFIE